MQTLKPGNGSVAVLDGVASLLDKSLPLQVKQEGNEPRLIMLETVREYGLACVRESGEAEVSQRAHALVLSETSGRGGTPPQRRPANGVAGTDGNGAREFCERR